jgi:hypothetical protein
MKPRAPVLTILAALALAAGCSSMSVNYDYDVEADFSSYHTYRWHERATITRDGVKQRAPKGTLLDKRIRRAAEDHLGEAGLTADEQSPDLLVVYHIGVEGKIEVINYGYSYYGYGWAYSGRRVDAYRYKEGTLVLDLVDAKTNQLVWRGFVTDTLDDGGARSPDEVESRLDYAFEKMLANYPPPR